MDIRRRFLGQKKAASSGGDSNGSYTVVLNSQWRKSTSIANPDSSLYDGVYESNSNYNVNSTAATMYIDILGLSSFKLYIRSYAESSWDYVMVSQLDQTINNSTSYSNTTLVKAHTRGNQQSGTAISNYTLVEFTGIDEGSHRITVVYRKDGSSHSGDDRGYVLIPKGQGTGSEEDDGGVDIDTTYSIMYTSSDGNVVTPYSTTVFGANITNNIYVNGQGIITFDKQVTMIGSSAFYNCSSLKEVTIPDSVTSIGESAFQNCSSLNKITIGKSLSSVGSNAFSGNSIRNVYISDLSKWCRISFTDASSNPLSTGYCYYFYVNNQLITTLNIPTGITSINKYAFYRCRSFTDVVIPNNITSIESDAFRSCTYLKTVSIGDGATSIGDRAFYDCGSLTSVTIGKKVNYIGNQAFDYDSKLSTVNYTGDLTSWLKISFHGDDSNPLYFGAKFYINNVELSSDITIPSSITAILKYVFSGYTSLESITIHENVNSIGYGAFWGCTSLKEVYCKPTTPPTGNAYMFSSNASDRKIYVPTASVEAYKAASYWSSYADYIAGYDFEITFSINGTQYQAQSGMTWRDWCGSEYNTGQYREVGNTDICDRMYENVVYFESTKVTPEDVILQNVNYTLVSTSS